MRRPALPSAAELKRADEAHPGSAKLLLDAHLSSLAKHEQRLDEMLSMQREAQQHIQRYRMVSIAAGVSLGAAALVVTAHAVEQHAGVAGLSLVITPVAGLAGVFIWGYRPSSSSSRLPPPPTDEADNAASATGTPKFR